MTTSLSSSLLQHPAFAGLSEAGRQSLSSATSIFEFKLGQLLADPRVIPAQVLLIQSGEARLLARDAGKLISLARLGTGDFVGLASLLRASPCEEVSSAGELIAVAIPDEVVLNLYRREKSFKSWCDGQIWAAEIFAVMQAALEGQAKQPSIQQLLRQAGSEARLITSDVARKELAQASNDPDRELLLSSANVAELAPGTRIGGDHPPLRPRPPLPARLLILPKTWAGAETAPDEAAATGSDGEPSGREGLQSAPQYPVPTGQNLGQADPSRDLKLIRGNGPLEETQACFQMLAQLMKLPYRRDAIEKTLRESLQRTKTPSLQMCGQLAANLGLHVAGVKVPAELSHRLQTPSMISWQEGFALVTASTASGVTLASPRQGWITVGREEMEELFPEGIEMLLFDRTATTPEERFNLNWFLPSIRRYRGVLTQVLLASLVVQLFTLVNPLLIQVIIDKVITQRSLDTLEVLGIALVVVTLLEGVLTSLRTFLFAETTNRIDMRLGAEVIDHLLRLPLNYFDRRPVGELASRVAELEKIRNFLTGQGLTTILDATFSVVYIVVMALYSGLLTLVALAVIPVQIGLTVLGSPLFRRQLRQGAEANAQTQSHLVEVLTGIQTVKAQNVEIVSRWKWQDLYGRYITRSFERTITGTTLSQTSQVLQKISQLMVLWVGASMVLKGELTLGQLIAFRIISGYVTQPLLRLSSIWQNIQEVKVSMERLADVVDTPVESTELDQQKIPLPQISGHVEFDDVSFSFTPGGKPVLNKVSCEFAAGSFIGIVGQSGSGKSTMMKLLPRLYSPQSGKILIDGYDIDKVELYSLRRQIGIVPQDPLLFSGTVAENIALTDPQATSESIVEAARQADAHDFIMQLPSGYSTPVGERGASLSGGQRQRIAIARTLLSRPRLLILDEATSALDYETEKRVCDNLMGASLGCTVFFITHRLNTVRGADRILLMHDGVISEVGGHDELMEQRGRYYALYRQQEASR